MNKKYTAIACGAAVLLAAVFFLSQDRAGKGQPDNGGGSPAAVGSEQPGTNLPEGESGQPGGAQSQAAQSGDAAGGEDGILSAEQAVEETAVPELSAAERSLFDKVLECLKTGDQEGAAIILNENDELLQELFYTTLEAQDWLYDGSRLTGVIDGTGLLFRRPTSVYYGSLKDGVPEGWGVAVQAIRINAGRYDYALGLWRQGRMEGLGTSGYRYYETPGEGELSEVKKEGYFTNNYIDGTVTYTSVNREGEDSSWRFTADHGVTVLDEKWNYIAARKEYLLLSEDDENHAYMLAEELAQEPLWKNQLVWE